jgi:hypothetical protein
MEQRLLFSSPKRALPVTGNRNFDSLYRFLQEKSEENKIKLVYRGEKLDRLTKRLSLINEEREEVLQRSFYLGDKARYFEDHFGRHRRQNNFQSINDCSANALDFIYSRLANVMTTHKWRHLIEEHIPMGFKEFFLTNDNRNYFTRTIQSITEPDAQLRARDYYLYLLHVAGSEGIRNDAMLVSSTADHRVAHKFAHFLPSPKKKWYPRTTPLTPPLTPLIFHYFVPRPFHKHAIAPWTIEEHEDLIFTLNLPTYGDHALFPNQLEVAIKGALFPQMILGIEIPGKHGQFIPNPHALTLEEHQFEEVARTGIPIDQTSFAEDIRNTNYIRWIERDLEGVYVEHSSLSK